MTSMDPAMIEERLKRFWAGRGTSQDTRIPHTEEIPMGMGARVEIDIEQQKINDYLRDVPDLIVTDPRLRDLPRITDNLESVRTDFPDDILLGSPAVLLQRYPEDVIAQMGRETIPMFTSGFSRKGVASLFVLAYHLKDPSDGSYVFSEDDTPTNMEDKPYDDYDDIIMQTRMAYQVLDKVASDEVEARAYSYLAASALRLFSKSEENYTRAFNHILAGHQRFYRTIMPLSPPQPVTDAVKTLSHLLSHGGPFKSTLYRLLYIGGGTTKAEGLRKFLYEMHIAYTGMHIVSIVIRLCNVLNCELGMLLSTVQSQEFQRQIDCLVTMNQLIASTSTTHRRRLWRYGRVFDERFMAPLQTKTCPSLTYILASALKSESSGSNQDILNIAQLAGFSPAKKRLLSASGEMVAKIIRKQMLDLEQAGRYPSSIGNAHLKEEIRRAESAIHLMGASVLEMCSVESQGPHGQRTAIVCLKVRPTPKKYPRDPGTPGKSPM